MVEKYSFVFWIHNNVLQEESIPELVCKIANYLQAYSGETVLNYESAYSKSKTKQIEMSREYILQRMCSIQDRKKKKHYYFDFFSSLEDARSIGVHFALGDFNEVLPNTVVVNFPTNYSKLYLNFAELWILFKSITSEVFPYYSFFANSLNNNLSEVYWDKKPTYVHTFNYFSNETIHLIGEDRIRKLTNTEVVKNGCYIKMLSEPLSIHNCTHLQIQKDMSRRLGLIP